MKSTKIVLIALVAIVVSSQGYGFQNFGVDQDLVRATDSSMSNLQGLLTVFSCQGNTYFLPYLASSIAMEEDSIPVVMPSWALWMRYRETFRELWIVFKPTTSLGEATTQLPEETTLWLATTESYKAKMCGSFPTLWILVEAVYWSLAISG